MITIYSDDPRGVHKALAEETAKGNKVRLRNAKFRPQPVETGPLDIYDMTKTELQMLLRDNGVPFESDANKPRLLELAEGL